MSQSPELESLTPGSSSSAIDRLRRSLHRVNLNSRAWNGCNPHQTSVSLTLPFPEALRILNGTPSFIKLLDTLNGWQLVRELRTVTGLPAASSFKHVSPAGAAVTGPISQQELETFDIAEPPASSIAN